MSFCPASPVLFLVLVFVTATGCQKADPHASSQPPTKMSADTIASVHWLGKRRLNLDADAYYLSRIWSLPETAQLQSQTFDRLATGSWRLLLGDAAAARIPAAVLRPLFDELALQESYLEIRDSAGAPPSCVLATHVSARYAGLWETNSAIAMELLAGSPAISDPAIHGWLLRRTNAPDLISLARVGEWTVISAGPAQNLLFDEIAARIRLDGVPFVSAGTNLWLEADLDLSRLGKLSALSADYSQSGSDQGKVGMVANFQHLNLSLSGDGGNIITRAKLTFSKPFPTNLEPWHIPLEFVHGPLAGFTAARGLKSWLAGWPVCRDLQIGTPPDQLYLWSLAGNPYQVYLAAPMSDPGVSALTDHLLQNGNPWLATHGYVSFDRAPDGNGLIWGHLADIKPFLKSVGPAADGWLIVGLAPDTNSLSLPPPAALMQDILRRTNLVYYDWELTGPRLQPCLQLAQSIRLIARQTQVSLNSASLNCLAALIPRLGTAATMINRTGPAELTLYRRSTLGLTAPELHLLTGWLESPDFPK